MKNILLLGLICTLSAFSLQAQEKKTVVESFNKVIVSPHIEVTFYEGDEESVVVESSEVSNDKLNIEVDGSTLRLYLDGAKTTTKAEKVKNNDYKGRRSLYDGTMVRAKVTYKTLERLSIRGEEMAKIESPIEQEDFHLTIYGESKVYFKEMTTEELTVSIYGESYLEIKGGSVGNQKYRAYGESEVNTLGMGNGSTKITAYGESNFNVNVSDRLRVTSYGEAKIQYEGDPDVDKGIVIGETSIRKIG